MTTLVLLALVGVLPPQRPAALSNRHFWASAKTDTSPEAVWNIWTNVPMWPSFDSGLEAARLTEAKQGFALGVRGELVADGRTSRFEVSQFDAGRSYTFITSLPLGKLHVHRVVEVLPEGGCTLTHEVWFTGLGGRVLSAVLGPKFREQLPSVVARVADLAERPTP